MKPELLVYDFDGVMTNNKVWSTDFPDNDIYSGHEMVRCDRRDGYAIEQLRALGYHQIILSLEKSGCVEQRGRKLGISTFTGVRDKGAFLSKWCRKSRFDLCNVLFVGDGLNDLSALKIVGHPCCPYDAHIEVLQVPNICVFGTNGGDGVILELYEMLEGDNWKHDFLE